VKIEMGEFLFYSWLRHTKECQVVQTNWKVSPQWQLQHEDELSVLMQITDGYFSDNTDIRFTRKAPRYHNSSSRASEMLLAVHTKRCFAHLRR